MTSAIHCNCTQYLVVTSAIHCKYFLGILILVVTGAVHCSRFPKILILVVTIYTSRLYPEMLIFVVTSVIHCKMMKKSCFTSTETVGLLGTGAQDGHLDFHTAPEL